MNRLIQRVVNERKPSKFYTEQV